MLACWCAERSPLQVHCFNFYFNITTAPRGWDKRAEGEGLALNQKTDQNFNQNRKTGITIAHNRKTAENNDPKR